MLALAVPALAFEHLRVQPRGNASRSGMGTGAELWRLPLDGMGEPGTCSVLLRDGQHCWQELGVGEAFGTLDEGSPLCETPRGYPIRPRLLAVMARALRLCVHNDDDKYADTPKSAGRDRSTDPDGHPGAVQCHHASAFAEVPKYAFANGFAVVEWQWDAEQHRRVYSCVHLGKPKNWRKLQAQAVSREKYDAFDGAAENGEKLRLRQGMTRQVACTWAVTPPSSETI
ncbi:hypothetical protein FN846DRAFT_894605 [Sphaerosporella brunnea]|uniref:Uncharacterized protein n=1 Tax=Sphaerosporella brunnea TaxID=1250544 RepID=A0A5J5EI90_9PEZI|nr:hypothetical protein FN846DRAFT_894605 [Sphaerosporella brunnea]